MKSRSYKYFKELKDNRHLRVFSFTPTYPVGTSKIERVKQRRRSIKACTFRYLTESSDFGLSDFFGYKVKAAQVFPESNRVGGFMPFGGEGYVSMPNAGLDMGVSSFLGREVKVIQATADQGVIDTEKNTLTFTINAESMTIVPPLSSTH